MQINFLYILASASLVLIGVNADTDYCDIQTCENPEEHTLCLFGLGEVDYDECGDLETDYLTAEEIQEILNFHNDHRAFVGSGQETRGNPGPQPAATNLGALKWDDELAGIAQTWANQCLKNEHDKCEDVERFPVNQNIAYKGSTAGYDATTWTDLMLEWYDEVDKFDPSNVESLTMEGSRGVEHYTQLMWADTEYVGCGGVRYNNDDKFYTRFLVCNYGPGGNYVGLPLYKTR